MSAKGPTGQRLEKTALLARGEGNGPAASRLGDPKCRTSRIDIAPFQRQRFSDAGAAVDEEHAKAVVILVSAQHRVEKVALFIDRKEPDAPVLFLEPDIRWQFPDQAGLLRFPEELVERGKLSINS